MLRSPSLAIFALALTVAAAPPGLAQDAPPAPQTPEAWRAAAETDLEALRTLIYEHTPIAFDDENPRMQLWLEQGYSEARERVRRVTNQPGHFYALAAYTNGFQDPHLSLSAETPWAVARWPGFVVAARGENVVVQYRDDGDPSAPALGTRIVSCDGRSPAELLDRIVFPFTLNPRRAGDRRSAVPRLFLDRGNPFAPPPRRCVVQEPDGRRTLTLDWRDVPDGYWTQYNLAGRGPRADFGVTAPADGVTWIGAPTFGNDFGEELQALVGEIEAGSETIRNGRAVVIDVRGNSGGNSAWGEALARAVWGADVIDALALEDWGPVDYRASGGNVDLIAGLAPELIAQFGEDSDVARWVEDIQQGLADAVARGVPLWRQSDETDPPPEGGGYTLRRPSGPSPIPAQVYVLSNGSCASACLDFADIALHIPGTLLIGSDTSGDGLLMESLSKALPSGLASVSLPMKVYRGRPRGALEAYTADIHYHGDWTDGAVRAWVMELIAAQE